MTSRHLHRTPRRASLACAVPCCHEERVIQDRIRFAASPQRFPAKEREVPCYPEEGIAPYLAKILRLVGALVGKCGRESRKFPVFSLLTGNLRGARFAPDYAHRHPPVVSRKERLPKSVMPRKAGITGPFAEPPQRTLPSRELSRPDFRPPTANFFRSPIPKSG